MNTLSRRDFLKIGVSSALGLTLSKVIESDVLLPAQAQELPLEFAFLIEPGTVNQIDTTTHRTFNTTLWGIPSEFEPILPTLLSPITLPLESLESWARERKENCDCSPTAVGPINTQPS